MLKLSLYQAGEEEETSCLIGRGHGVLFVISMSPAPGGATGVKRVLGKLGQGGEPGKEGQVSVCQEGLLGEGWEFRGSVDSPPSASCVLHWFLLDLPAASRKGPTPVPILPG